jgi:cytochrome-b5 reductase
MTTPTPTPTPTPKDLKKYTMKEIEEHNKDDDVWVIVHDKVYDLSKFYKNHPAGPDVIMDFAGKDGTQSFDDSGHPGYAKKEMNDYLIGEVEKVRTFSKLEEIAEHN